MNNFLYHNTDFIYFLGILEKNEIFGVTKQTITGKEYKGVSLTRDKNFRYAREFTLILDKDKLKQNYKIIPFDFWNANKPSQFIKGKGNPERHVQGIELEEFVIGDIKNLNKYLIGVRINYDDTYQEIVNDKEVENLIGQHLNKFQKIIFLDKNNKKINLFENMSLKNILKTILIEGHIYNKLLDLEKQYNEQAKELEKIQDYKIWKLKSKRLFSQYLLSKQKLLNGQHDVFALKGNMNSKYLYHYTNADNLLHILKDNYMIDSGEGTVSFSTNPNLYKRGFIFWHPSKYSEGRHSLNSGVKIKLDFDKLKKDNYVFKLGSENHGTHFGEEEIYAKTDALENIRDYIIEIIILTSKETNKEIPDKLKKYLEKTNIKFTII